MVSREHTGIWVIQVHRIGCLPLRLLSIAGKPRLSAPEQHRGKESIYEGDSTVQLESREGIRQNKVGQLSARKMQV